MAEAEDTRSLVEEDDNNEETGAATTSSSSASSETTMVSDVDLSSEGPTEEVS